MTEEDMGRLVAADEALSAFVTAQAGSIRAREVDQVLAQAGVTVEQAEGLARSREAEARVMGSRTEVRQYRQVGRRARRLIERHAAAPARAAKTPKKSPARRGARARRSRAGSSRAASGDGSGSADPDPDVDPHDGLVVVREYEPVEDEDAFLERLLEIAERLPDPPTSAVGGSCDHPDTTGAQARAGGLTNHRRGTLRGRREAGPILCPGPSFSETPAQGLSACDGRPHGPQRAGDFGQDRHARTAPGGSAPDAPTSFAGPSRPKAARPGAELRPPKAGARSPGRAGEGEDGQRRRTGAADGAENFRSDSGRAP